jgi:hypothetical protein
MLSLPIEISMFQNSSSPFLAWINTPIINLGVLIFIENNKNPKRSNSPQQKKNNWASLVNAGSPLFFTIFGLG